MNRTTLAGLSLAALLTILVLLGLTLFRHQVRGVWQTALDTQQMRRDLAEGRRFPQALAAAKAQGLPTEMADLQKPLPPPARNAAPIYVRLMLLLKAHPFTPSEKAAMTLHPGVSPSAAQWAQIDRLMHDRADAMALVHQAALRPDCVFARNWTKGDPIAINFPELATVRTAAQLLRIESLLVAHRGKMQAAVQNQALGFQVARHGASDGLSIPYLVGVAGDVITLDGLKRIMIMAGPDASLDDAVGTLIARGWKPRRLSDVWHNETAFGLGDIEYLRQTSANGKANPFLDYNGLFLLTEVEHAAQVADGPYATAKSALSQVEADATDRRHGVRFLASILIPLPDGAGSRARDQALCDVTRAGAAVLAESARTGHPPDHLPFAVTDPYTDKPLGYRREGAQGFVIYSAGADGRFDGGKPGEYHWQPYQVAFRYPSAASSAR